MSETIGTRIKKLRKEYKWTQQDLADKVNVTSQVVSNWERGYTNPDKSDLSNLSKILIVTTDYLVLGGEKNNSKFILNIMREQQEEKDKLFTELEYYLYENDNNLIKQIVLERTVKIEELFTWKHIDLSYNGKTLTENEKKKIINLINVILTEN
ncbi:helix-turn-helix domain-containing protein [Paenibacillus sp. LMG 31456]|uniref:Helix-turn-helix domain-containing protein n=1 Tax=Paenibacillus foliorum TaxID=2654974 RepID=A0A972K068_9BACL|nr:helix-turn-helix domain-containing protein [Paenibacillus foliorum]NOU95319.1 helix-turn-helix domain-containing protein [Paenibacillus foliorum]